MKQIRELARNAARSRLMPVWLGVFSFLENTLLLIAIEPLYIPVMVANQKRVFVMATALVAGCLVGALVTYWTAAMAYEPFVEPVLRSLGLAEDFDKAREDIETGGFWAMFLIGLTPIPFQLGTVASGLIGLDLVIFSSAVVLSRAIRYFGLALLVLWVGMRAQKLIEKYELEIFAFFLAIFVAGLVIAWLLRA